MKTEKSAFTLKDLTKGTVWDMQESDVFAMFAQAEKDDELVDNVKRYLDILRTAFDMEEVKIDRPEIIKKYEERGMRVGVLQLPGRDKTERKWAVKKHTIMRVTDLTYENIHHISAAKLLEVIDRNFGGGWDSLPQSVKDVIEAGFEISTTTLPKDRLRKPGGLYEMKVADGFEVLEIEKGGWIEAIFAKVKPKALKPRVMFNGGAEDGGEEDEDVDIKDTYYQADEDDDIVDEDSLTEESYRTTIEQDPDELSLDAAEISEEGYEE